MNTIYTTALRFTVRFRQDDTFRLKDPRYAALNGCTFEFLRGWDIESPSIYAGEVAWMPCSPEYPPPDRAPAWIASGDLEAA